MKWIKKEDLDWLSEDAKDWETKGIINEDQSQKKFFQDMGLQKPPSNPFLP